MDNIIIPVSGASQAYKPPIQTTADTNQASTPAPQNIQAQAVAVSQNTTSTTAQAVETIQAQYEQAARQAALSFKNSYPLGDQSFSIFKDATGQYITRYVSLIDGSITYVPQPTLVKPDSTLSITA